MVLSMSRMSWSVWVWSAVCAVWVLGGVVAGRSLPLALGVVLLVVGKLCY